MIRQPIVVVMGHVDHGKTSLLDAIRNTSVAKKEAGAITQHIGAHEVPISILQATCTPLIAKMGTKFTIPGLLFIDTPGHEAFTNLRERGGSIADIAVLVVDVMQGFQPQTLESIKILRQYKTPFILAANKIDMLQGWRPVDTNCFNDSLISQRVEVQQKLDEKIYGIVGRLGELGIESERFDRITDFTKQVVIVPVSAKTGEGVGELLLFLAGLSQKFLEDSLKTEVSGPAKGSIIEVKEERGLGTVIDVIIYDGTLNKGDRLVFGTINGAKETNVRGLLKPKLPSEITDPADKYKYVEGVSAAAGVRVYAPGMEGALSGSPILEAKSAEQEKELVAEINDQIKKILFESTNAGVILKADTLGSVEALVRLLVAANIPVRDTGIGRVTKSDVANARGVSCEDPYAGVVLAFNVAVNDDAQAEADSSKTPIFKADVVYNLVDQYAAWVKEQKEADKKVTIEQLPLPAKILVLPNHFFRASKPAVFGIEVLDGALKAKVRLVNAHGDEIGEVSGMQHEKKSVELATKGMSVAISIDSAVCGKSFTESEVLFVRINKKEAEMLKSKGAVSGSDLALLDEIMQLTCAARI
jgi:translation initiation factor 5B